jgi:hypothetical protein
MVFRGHLALVAGDGLLELFLGLKKASEAGEHQF